LNLAALFPPPLSRQHSGLDFLVVRDAAAPAFTWRQVRPIGALVGPNLPVRFLMLFFRFHVRRGPRLRLPQPDRSNLLPLFSPFQSGSQFFFPFLPLGHVPPRRGWPVFRPFP
jgi:hypothetical protein